MESYLKYEIQMRY